VKTNEKTLQNPQRTDSIVSPAEGANRVQDVPSSVGRSLPSVAEGTTELACTTPAAVVSTSGKFTQVRAEANQSRTTTVDELSPFNQRALQLRAEEIDSEYEGETIETIVPIQVLETARQWLRSKNLIWASNDIAFWTAFEYVLGSLETFSVDAVEQALIICATSAVDNPARRATIYQELRACRAIKKIRDLQMKIRTAEAVANHALSAPFKERAEATIELSIAYAVFIPPPYNDYQYYFETLVEGQNKVQENADNTGIPESNSHFRRAEVRLVGLNAAGTQVKDYGVVDESGNVTKVEVAQ
jgi:hypothetical protein